PRHAIADLCRRYHVRELSIFGSALRDDFRDDSDLDLLVDFEADATVGMELIDVEEAQHSFRATGGPLSSTHITRLRTRATGGGGCGRPNAATRSRRRSRAAARRA